MMVDDYQITFRQIQIGNGATALLSPIRVLLSILVTALKNFEDHFTNKTV